MAVTNPKALVVNTAEEFLLFVVSKLVAVVTPVTSILVAVTIPT